MDRYGRRDGGMMSELWETSDGGSETESGTTGGTREGIEECNRTGRTDRRPVTSPTSTKHRQAGLNATLTGHSQIQMTPTYRSGPTDTRLATRQRVPARSLQGDYYLITGTRDCDNEFRRNHDKSLISLEKDGGRYWD